MSSTGDKAAGVVITAVTGMTYLNAAMSALISNPNWFGLFLAISTCSVGLAACASIIRDKL